MAGAFDVPFQTMQGLQGLRAQRQQFDAREQQMGIQQQQADAQAQLAQAQAERQKMLQQKLQGVMNPETGQLDPKGLTSLILTDPEIGGAVQKQLGLVDEAQKTQALNKASSLKQILKTAPPEQALQMFQEGGYADDPVFKGLADNLQAGDIEGAINELGYGVAAVGGQEAFDAFQGAQDPSDFARDLQAAGIQPGSEEFKKAVLEKYGKGKTIGWDVVESVNPETGQNEYYQVSRTDPGAKVPLNMQVPTDPRVEAAQNKAQSAQREQAQKDLSTVTDMMENVEQIINSPGLESWSGWQSIAPVAPGTSQADTDALVERLQSQQFLKNISQMRGMGALSNAEGQKVAAAAAALKRTMTDAAVKKELDRIRSELNKAKRRIESGQLLPQSEREPMGGAVPNVNASEGRSQADRAANAAADAGVVNWSDL